MARDQLVTVDHFSANEITLRVKSPDRAVSPKVNLWPGDEDFFCDCNDRVIPCAHVAASIAYLKNTPAQEGPSPPPSLHYRFARNENRLLFYRTLGDVPLTESLVSLVGGIQSGRIARPRIFATQDDFAIDRVLNDPRASNLDRMILAKLLPLLKSLPAIELDGRKIQIGPPTNGFSVVLRDEGPGFRLVCVPHSESQEIFENGAVLQGDTLQLIEDPGLTSAERQLIAPPGRWYGGSEVHDLVTRVLPLLEKKVTIQILSKKLPQASDSPPRIVLRTEKEDEHTLYVTPTIEYASEYSIRNPVAERELGKKLQSELHLGLGQRTRFQGLAAVSFVQRAKDWDMTGNARREFALEPSLTPDFMLHDKGVQLSFKSSGGKSVDSSVLFKAWRQDETHVSLLGGGYAPLPSDWLKKFGSRLQRLLAAQEKNGDRLPSHLKPELIQLSDETGATLDDPLKSLKNILTNFESIPQAPLPTDLRADLRRYQIQGVNWLCFLRGAGMGALLADDMGLGKTLQALCAIQGRTLIVAPASVLHSWADQIRQFRPGLTLSLYYGSKRELQKSVDVTITTYGLLRQDRDLLLAQEWNTAILDEAQTIKNPESQVTQAAHQLRAQFRITLSGTPVENSLDDLWSQFQFLNPGLLGTRREFQEESNRSPHILRKRIRPFILRRLKKDVAPELPPRTEVVLRCQLSPSEQELYDALLASSRTDVLEKIDQGGSVFGALELLLRLRQACCHPNLVPGQEAASSAKLDLLAQTLESSIAQGHRALVFSQWTSYLDLIEPRLKSLGITFVRLDGSTPRRDEVVARFQDPAGPPVMLISLKAGGVGLTLTAADHVILMDSWWNPAVEEQAADRAHRIGQEDPVLICRLIAENTVEEKILALQEKKRQLSNSILDGSARAASLTREDLLALLDPVKTA